MNAAVELQAAIVIELAHRMSAAPAYAVAPLAAQLREARAELPQEPIGDAWDLLVAAIRSADYCPNCPCDACAAVTRESAHVS